MLGYILAVARLLHNLLHAPRRWAKLSQKAAGPASPGAVDGLDIFQTPAYNGHSTAKPVLKGYTRGH